MGQFRDNMAAHYEQQRERERYDEAKRAEFAAYLGDLVSVLMEREIEPLPVYLLDGIRDVQTPTRGGIFRQRTVTTREHDYRFRHNGWLVLPSHSNYDNDYDGIIVTEDIDAYTMKSARLVTEDLNENWGYQYKGIHGFPAILTGGDTSKGSSYMMHDLDTQARRLAESGDHVKHALDLQSR